MTIPIATKTASRNHRWETREGGDTDPTLSLCGLSLRGVFQGTLAVVAESIFRRVARIASRPEVGPARFGFQATSSVRADFQSGQIEVRRSRLARPRDRILVADSIIEEFGRPSGLMAGFGRGVGERSESKL